MGKMKLPIPHDLNPKRNKCVTLIIPADIEWQSMFWGNLYNLTSATIFADDATHSAKVVANVWWEIYQAARAAECCPDGPQLIDIAEMEYEMSICEQLRYENGKLQGLCCGEWTDIAGQEGIVTGGPGQPGGGAPQPGPGDCQVYHAQFEADSTWLLPAVVNAGDILNFSNADGSGGDGAFLSGYYCPDGGTFFAGGCLPIYGTNGADPAPALRHMALVAKIGALYYNAYSGSITVPVGIANAPVVIQVNDSVMSDNSGSYSLDIELCNNQAADWSHVLNMALDQNGFVLTSQGSGAQPINGKWTAGIGFEARLVLDPTNAYTFLSIQYAFASPTTLKSISALYSETLGTNGGGGTLGNQIGYLDVGLVKHNLATSAAATVSGQTLPWTGAQLAYGMTAQFWVGDENGVTDPGGSVTLPQITVSGSGFDPWA